MKRLLQVLIFLIALTEIASAQSNPPITVTDGTNTKTQPSTLIFPSISVVGGTVTIGGGGGGGTVTAVSGVNTNGFTFSIANPTTTPAITLNVSALDATKVADGSVSNAEFQRLDGVTSGIQSQLNAKVDGSGTTGTLPIWTSGTGLGDSMASQSGVDFTVQSIGNITLGDPGALGNSTTVAINDAGRTVTVVATNGLTLPTVTAGLWHGTVIGAVYGGFGADVSAQTGIALNTAGTFSWLGSTGTGNVARVTGSALTALTGLGIRSTGAAFDLTLASSEVLTAGRTLSFNVGDAARTLTIPGSTTVPIASQAITISGPTAARTWTVDDAAFTIATRDRANTFTADQTLSSASLTFSGNISASGLFSTSGIRHKGVAATFTDTASSGTVADARTNTFGGNTLVASSATTITNYYTAYFSDPTASTNVTLTNKWSIGADSLKVGTSNPLTVSAAGLVAAGGSISQVGGATASTYVRSNSGNLASTTNLNPGFLVFGDSSTNAYGMDIGASASTFGLRLFSPNNVDFASSPSGSAITAQSSLTYRLRIDVLNGATILASSGVYGFSSNTNPAAAGNDTAISRISQKLIGVGNGTQGDFSANIKATEFVADATVVATGTTGAQTINKTAGSVNFAAAATSLVVTDSLVTTSSIINCTVATNDATFKSCQCVAASGSFTIFASAAATSETRVNFWITN